MKKMPIYKIDSGDIVKKITKLLITKERDYHEK